MDNKRAIAEAGGIEPLIQLAEVANEGVQIEAIAALANLAVNDANEIAIGRKGGLYPIITGAKSRIPELQAQSARALRNLSVNGACAKCAVVARAGGLRNRRGVALSG